MTIVYNYTESTYLTKETMMPRAPLTKPSSAAVVLTRITYKSKNET